MKKTLIALAAVAATGVVFAQSSVTLYGVADVSAGKVTDGKFQVNANSGLNNGNSRLGVRGTEDLGGGLKAGFNFEQGINAGTGATDAVTFHRAAWMNLSGGFGDLRLGRSLSSNFYGVAPYDLTGTANYSAIGSQFGWAGSSRNDGQIMYTTPDMGGFTASLSHVLKGNNGGNSHNGLNAIYKNGPLAVALAYSKTQNTDNAAKALGATYNFGSFAIAGGYHDPAGDSKGFSLAGSTNMGPVSLVLQIARDTDAKDTNIVFETKYALSKRTFAYGVVSRDGKGKTAENSTGYAIGVRHNF